MKESTSSTNDGGGTHTRTIQFARGTLARLALWPALRLAVHASWGGPASAEKQRWLAGVLVDQFEPFILLTVATSTSSSRTFSNPSDVVLLLPSSPPPPPDEMYIEELLMQIMADEFDVALEDDSAAVVARDMVKLFAAVCADDEAFVLELEAQAERVAGKVPQYARGVGSGSEDSDDSDSDNENDWEDEDEVPQLLNRPQVDEDGFTLVNKKKGRR